MSRTRYTSKDLQREAVSAIRAESKQRGMRGKLLSWTVSVGSPNAGTSLVALGEWRDGTVLERHIAL